MVNENFWVTGAYEAVLDDLVSLLHGDDVQDFDAGWDQFLLSIHQTTFWKVCFRCANVSLINFNNVLARYEPQMNQNLSKLS